MSRTLEEEPAIVLRAIAYGEADRVVTMLTQQHGKVAALAKGARRSVKRFAGGLGLFSVGRATFVDRPQAELARLERFEATAMWPGLLADLGKIAHAGYVAELLDALLPPRQAEPELFALALTFIRALDGGEASAGRLRVFEMHLLRHLGLRPELDRCVVCSSEPDDAPGQRLDPQRGGVVCARCRGEGPLLDGETRSALLDAQAADLASEPPSFSPEVTRSTRTVLQAVFLAHLPHALKSVSFIEKLNQATP